MEWSGRGLMPGSIPVFTWRDWGNPRWNLLSAAGLQAEIWNRSSSVQSTSDNHLLVTSRDDSS
jgi:hypothetical protein